MTVTILKKEANVKNPYQLKDLVLMTANQGGDMHPGVAVANVLSLLAQAAPYQCLQDWKCVVRTATVDDNRTTITVDDNGTKTTYELRLTPWLPLQERCLSPNRTEERPYEEAYWILNPGPKNNTCERLVVKCEPDRHSLAACREKLEEYCKNNTLPCIRDIYFK